MWGKKATDERDFFFKSWGIEGTVGRQGGNGQETTERERSSFENVSDSAVRQRLLLTQRQLLLLQHLAVASSEGFPQGRQAPKVFHKVAKVSRLSTRSPRSEGFPQGRQGLKTFDKVAKL